jgi:hypothetical protein
MSVASGFSGVLDRVAESSSQQLVLRAVVVLGSVTFLGVVPLAGGVFHPVFSAALVLVAVVVAFVPESHGAVALLLGLSLLWTLSVPRELGAWLLLAAALLLVVHVACTLAGLGPAGHAVDGRYLGLWVRRTFWCWAAAFGIWLLARAVALVDVPGSPFGLGAALLALLAWVTVITVHVAPVDADD